MNRILVAVFILTVSFVTKSISYGHYEDQIRDYYDTLYQRSEQVNSEQGPSEVKFSMPGVHPTKHDSYLCTAIDLRKRREYIVGFKPFAEMHTAHHMLMFGCYVPAENAFASEGKYWNCGDMGKGICGSGEKIVYAWGRNAPELKLPDDVAFEVGKDTDTPFLVLQVHYGKVDKFLANPSRLDYSGVNLQVTPVQPKHLAAIYLLASGGEIPAKEKAWHLDMGCKYGNGPELHPFAFRVHAHTLGTVITGYRIRNGVWTLIGKGDPQRPQAFYPVESGKNVSIRKDDTLAARCTYDSTKRDRITYIGATMADEMCNFYMMYWFDPKQNDFGGNPEESCGSVDESQLKFPADSDVPLPGSGHKMEMKRDFVEGSDESVQQ